MKFYGSILSPGYLCCCLSEWMERGPDLIFSNTTCAWMTSYLNTQLEDAICSDLVGFFPFFFFFFSSTWVRWVLRLQMISHVDQSHGSGYLPMFTPKIYTYQSNYIKILTVSQRLRQKRWVTAWQRQENWRQRQIPVFNRKRRVRVCVYVLCPVGDRMGFLNAWEPPDTTLCVVCLYNTDFGEELPDDVVGV